MDRFIDRFIDWAINLNIFSFMPEIMESVSARKFHVWLLISLIRIIQVLVDKDGVIIIFYFFIFHIAHCFLLCFSPMKPIFTPRLLINWPCKNVARLHLDDSLLLHIMCDHVFQQDLRNAPKRILHCRIFILFHYASLFDI